MYIFKELDPDLIHYQDLHVAFRTSPTPSLHAKAGEPPLEHRRLKLSMNYFLKIKYLQENPWFVPIIKSSPSELFEKSKNDPPLGTRILPHILETDIDPTSIDSQNERTPFPWG